MSVVPRSIGPGGRIGSASRNVFKTTSLSQCPLSAASQGPQNFRIKVDVTYRKTRIAQRIVSSLPPRHRLLKDIGWQHIVMTLEATIERDQEDQFQFPGRNKKGCELEMDLKFNGGKSGHGEPKELRDGSFKSRLNNKITSVE
jgi:hypothetical protein